jgi:hypothetical protein
MNKIERQLHSDEQQQQLEELEELVEDLEDLLVELCTAYRYAAGPTPSSILFHTEAFLKKRSAA